MKKWLIVIMVMVFVSSGCFALGNGTPQVVEAATTQAEDELRGVWIASVYNIDYPSSAGLNSTQLKKELDTILDNVQKMNMNAIFFQVRPVADALYPSQLYPWSVYLTGTQGQAPVDGFDSLAYLVAEGKKRGIAIHAWINPYKVTRGSSTKPNHDLTALSENHPARKYADLIVSHPNGELFFNPGEPMSRYLVLQGVKELIENYDIAGIHYDDYFYPDKFAQKDANGKTTYIDFNDQATYEKYGSGFSSVDDWRRNNVDLLVYETYQLVKSLDSTVQFGVSPAGIWADKSSNPLGSNTSSGYETYYDHYADTKKWVENHWLDYIAPQIYWRIGHNKADYATLVDWWSNVAKNSEVKLYIGHAAYKVGDSAQGEQWMDGNELARQITYNVNNGGTQGSIFYGYGNLAKNTLGIRDQLANIYAE